MITMDRVLAREARAVFRKLFGRQGHNLSVPLKIDSSGFVRRARKKPSNASRAPSSGRARAIRSTSSSLLLCTLCSSRLASLQFMNLS